MDDAVYKKIVAVALKGERDRGSGGAVLHDTDSETIGYALVHEFRPPEFAAQLAEMLTNAENSCIFVVQKTDKAYHVWTIPRGELARMVTPQAESTARDADAFTLA